MKIHYSDILYLSMSERMGLRERKKQQTKDALLKSAYYFFKKKGYENTSIEEITARANFAPRTFFLHFTSKEDLVFPFLDDVMESLTELFKQRGDTPALTAYTQWQLTTAMDIKALKDPRHNEIRRDLIAESRHLQARLGTMLDTIEGMLAVELAKDRGLTTPDLSARVAAAAALAIFTTLYEHGVEHLSRQDIAKAVDEAASYLKDTLDIA